MNLHLNPVAFLQPRCFKLVQVTLTVRRLTLNVGQGPVGVKWATAIYQVMQNVYQVCRVMKYLSCDTTAPT